MESNELLFKTLRKMQEEFSSKQFCKVARKLGVSQLVIQQNKPFKFLLSYADRTGRGTWKKKSDHVLDAFAYTVNPKIEFKEEKPISKIKSTSQYLEQFPIDVLVRHLQNKGYIVLTP